MPKLIPLMVIGVIIFGGAIFFSLRNTVAVTIESVGIVTSSADQLFAAITDLNNLQFWYPFLSIHDPNEFRFDEVREGLGARFELNSGPSFSSWGEITRINEPTMVELKIHGLKPCMTVQHLLIEIKTAPKGYQITMTHRESPSLFGTILSGIVGGNKLIKTEMDKSIQKLNTLDHQLTKPTSTSADDLIRD